MTNIKIKSYAKLNLTLEIDGKNSNGYHKISGVFQNISLFVINTSPIIKSRGIDASLISIEFTPHRTIKLGCS